MESPTAASAEVAAPVVAAEPVAVVDPHEGMVRCGFGWMTKEAAAAAKVKRIAGLEKARVAKALKAAGNGKDELEGFRKMVQWVLSHIDQPTVPKKASKEAKALLKWAKEQRGEFFGKYVPMLVRGERPEERKEEKRDEGAEESRELLLQWVQAYQQGQPMTANQPALLS